MVFVDICQEGKYIDYLVIHETKTQLLSQNNIKREYKNVLNLKTHLKTMSTAFYIFTKELKTKRVKISKFEVWLVVYSKPPEWWLYKAF